MTDKITQSGKATLSFVLGLLSFVFSIILSIPAIILGALALRDIGRSDGKLKGSGLAISGIVIGSFTLLIMPAILAALLMPAVQAARTAARQAQSMNQMKMISLALLNYHDMHHAFPPAYQADPAGASAASWRSLVAPYLENDPSIWFQPGAGDASSVDYVAVVDPEFIFSGERPISAQEIYDGRSNTILFVECTAIDADWMEPRDLSWEEFKALYEDRKLGISPSSFLAAMADGSVQRISYDTPIDDVHALLTRSGGETVADL